MQARGVLTPATCSDRLPACSTLWDSCQWPHAMLCLNTCGQCQRIDAAQECMSLADECDWETDGFCKDLFDRHAFFNRVLNVAHSERLDVRVLSKEPWILEFSSFLIHGEVGELIRIAKSEGLQDDREHPKHLRNASVSTCDSPSCSRRPFINELARRVSHLLGVSARNFEGQQFIHYEPGQHYSWHPDEYSWRSDRTDPVQVNAGPRVLTMFFYLNDVDEGGETTFMGPHNHGEAYGARGVVVRPQKGKAILWANMQDDWRRQDVKAVHRSLPVTRGVKWASTLWVHSSGFRIPELYAGRACSGRGV